MEVFVMSYVEFFTCRVAIQVCIGHFPNGRMRRRTFSMRKINPDASVESIAEVVRALAPLLIYPIIKVRKIVKRTLIFDPAEFAPAPAAAVAVVEHGTPRAASPTMPRNFFVATRNLRSGVAPLGDPCRVGNLPVLVQQGLMLAGLLCRGPPALPFSP